VFSGSYASRVTRWTVGDGELVIAGRDDETGDQVTGVPAAVEGETGVEFALDGRYALDVLSAIGSSQVQICLTTPTSPITFRPLGDDTYIHVIMPQHVGR